VEEILTRFVSDLIGRLTGPLTMRLFLQPSVAAFFAVRDGLKDAREGRPFHFWRMVTGPPDARIRRAKETWRAVSKVFIMAVAFDLVYQWLALPKIYPIESVVTATILAIIPYVVLRGVTNRIVRWRVASQAGRSGKVIAIFLAACLGIGVDNAEAQRNSTAQDNASVPCSAARGTSSRKGFRAEVGRSRAEPCSSECWIQSIGQSQRRSATLLRVIPALAPAPARRT